MAEVTFPISHLQDRRRRQLDKPLASTGERVRDPQNSPLKVADRLAVIRQLDQKPRRRAVTFRVARNPSPIWTARIFLKIPARCPTPGR
jgi:hypothetical protein